MTILAHVRTYNDLIEALRARKDALGISHDQLDALAGTPSRYAGKIFGAAHVRALGPLSFDNYLGALGVRIQIVEDETTAARIRARIGKDGYALKGVKRVSSRPRTLLDSIRRAHVMFGRRGGRISGKLRMEKLTVEQRKSVAKIGALALARKRTPAERSEAARKAVQARWKKRKQIGIMIEKQLER